MSPVRFCSLVFLLKLLVLVQSCRKCSTLGFGARSDTKKLLFCGQDRWAANPLHLQHGMIPDLRGFCGQGCGCTPTRWQFHAQ